MSTRPDCLREEQLPRLAAWGVETVELGAQSMRDSVLAASGRGHRAEDTVRAVRLLREYGFRVVLQMMTGLPGAEPDDDRYTEERLTELRPDGVRIYPTLVLRATPLAALWLRGEYRAKTVEEAVETCAPILERFRQAGIPVLRLGLHPSRELEEKVLAGPYHPALGELVWSRLYRDRAQALLAERQGLSSPVTLLVHPGGVSKMTGAGRANLRWLMERFRLSELRVAEAGYLPPRALEIKANV